jgi:hypothetical protein
MRDGIQNSQETLQTRHLKLPRLLHDFFELLTRRVVPQQRRVDHAAGGHPGRHALLQRLGKVPAADQTGQPGQELADVHAGPVEVGQPLNKDRSSEAQAPDQEPDQRSAFGDKINHGPGNRE